MRIKACRSLSILIQPEYPTGIKTVKAGATENGAIYNLAGQKVDENYKGVVIQNGKKVVVK